MKKIVTLIIIAVMGFGAMAEGFNYFDRNSDGKPSFLERSMLSFYWGFNGWGGSTFSGLMGEDLGGNNVRTSFSSYQLSYGYNILNTYHFVAGIGLGYESDVYKFKNAYVSFDDGAFQAATPAIEGDWSSRFVTRYVQVPVHVGWRSGDGVFKVRLSAIPAIGYTTKNTGLKHRMKEDGQTHKDQTNLSDALLPYKLDVRLEFKVYGVGLFMQVSTFKLFKDGYQDLYPFKFGFVI